MNKESNQISYDSIKEIASAFVESEAIKDISRITSGLVNDTYLVSYIVKDITNFFVIQRINTSIFENPLNILSNYELILEAKQNNRLFKNNYISTNSKQFIIPSLLINRLTSKSFYRSDQYYWRAFEYIPSSKTYTHISDTQYSFNILQSLSIFHYISSDIDLSNLKLILPSFHNTPAYLKELEVVLENKNLINFKLKTRVSNLLDFIKSSRVFDFSSFFLSVILISLFCAITVFKVKRDKTTTLKGS